MGIVSVETLTAPLSEEAPCGVDVSDEAAYGELDRAAQGTPEQEMAGEVIEAVGPNWLDVANKALEMSQRTRDLRVIFHLVLAALQLDGFAGLRDGLAVLRGVLEKFWDHVHPQLDPEDDNDPFERVNILASMTTPEASYGDPYQFLRRVRSAPLCSSRRMGRFGLRDIGRAASGREDTEGDAPTAEQIEAAFRDTDVVELQSLAQAVQDAAEHVRGIDTLVTLQVGADQAPDFAGLLDALTEAGKELEKYIGGSADGEGEGAGGAGEEAGAQAAPRKSRPGEVHSPQDVLIALDGICRYYGSHEPSSPVPLLLRRAQRLVAKGFAEIIQDLAPSSTSQLEEIFGANSMTPQEE